MRTIAFTSARASPPFAVSSTHQPLACNTCDRTQAVAGLSSPRCRPRDMFPPGSALLALHQPVRLRFQQKRRRAGPGHVRRPQLRRRPGDLQGCPLSAKLASPGKIDLIATAKSDNSLLSVRTDLPAVLQDRGTDRPQLHPDRHARRRSLLIAYNDSGDVDRISVFVEEVQQLVYNEISSAAGIVQASAERRY